MFNNDVIFTAHLRNKRLQSIRRGVKRIRNKGIEIALGEAVATFCCRPLKQCVGNNVKNGSPVIIRKQNLEIGLENVKRKAKAHNT
ncbi:hypothetical protein EV102420_09_00800 [Pseudescherichia vulneris NBRC 102420]|uniref:Uncharacterized protein n=1 Tax=Pseudescherichia vulneris NBRC 102420 TaxID=1115515 RepID=A0A090V1U3_PSEVU|nr:hypothetical protein EV102420_09_00800 [Pseudescherichia vulneris NBRC 102420]